jgi:hypothetical protein
MSAAHAVDKSVRAPLLFAFALPILFIAILPLSVCAQQSRGGVLNIQPYTPIRQPVLAPSGYNPGFVNRSVGYVPAYSVPQSTAAGNYIINANQFWRSESGYYYPWLNNSAYGQIIYAPQVNQAPVAQAPPLSTIFADLLKYIDEKKAQGLLSLSDYKHLRRRATDLQTKYFDLRTAGEGSIDEHDEAQIRRDLDELGAEVAKSVKA